MKIAFIVLTFNRPDALLVVLRGLALQCRVHHEVLIADDGSSETSISAVKAGLPDFECQVRHVWHEDTGFTASRARNLAAALTTADYLVFIDGDCVPNPQFVSAHTRLAETGCFVNGSRVLLGPALTQQAIKGSVDLCSASRYAWIRWRLRGEANKLIHLVNWPDAPFRAEKAFRWKKIRSCNFALWREDFMAVNGFDETFHGWGHEDADLVLRLHNAGLVRKNGFCATEVYHLWHPVNSRVSEADNRNKVIRRIASGEFRACLGVAETLELSQPLVTCLN